MLNEKIESILNQQIEKEAYSSNLYLSMASWAQNNGLEGTAEWLFAQAEEEKMHMLKFIQYINDRGGKAIIPALPQPPHEFENVQELFEQVMKHEQYISASINEIVAATIEVRDFTSNNWIQWFVTEQIEEEATVNAILDRLKLLDGKNFYLFDRDLKGIRTAE